MNYLTLEELKSVTALVEFCQERFWPGAGIFIAAECYDSNGERLGEVTVTEGGEYGFIPGEKTD